MEIENSNKPVTCNDVEDMHTDKVEEIEQEKISNKEETANDVTVDKEKTVTCPYEYANSGDTFTSESFKIEIMHLPKYCGFKQLRKRLNTLKVDPVKIKIPYNSTYGFATFRSEEERTAAIQAIDGNQWKNTTLRAKKAAPSADPLLQKRRNERENSSDSGPVKKARLEDNTPALPAEERLKDAVTPTWREPYERQLVLKQRNMRTFLSSLPGDVIRQNRDLQSWVNAQKRKHDGLMCPLVPIKPSPQTDDYRNKCEFTVGRSEEEKDKTVGFRLGSYKDGTVHVMSPDACNNIAPIMKTVVKSVEKYLQSVSPGTGFDPQEKDGNWRMVTVRTNAESHVMVVMHFNPMQLSQDEINAEKQRIKTFFESGEGKDSGVTSLYFQIKNEHRVRGSTDNVNGDYELLLGESHIQEKLLGLTFRISPSAFFQVNTPAAEVLYSTVREWANIGPTSTVLDVCCGTGTIGITMAKHVKRVIGIEMCKEAVDDAVINAQLNGVEDKCAFHAGKAEDVLPDLIKTIKYSSEDVVAVVDPPRGGLHRDVVKALRKHEFVKRLVYVSCKASSVRNNIIDLMRAPSKQVKGEPFRLVSAVPVDLFPHTDHCELVMLFERGIEETEKAPDKAKDTAAAVAESKKEGDQGEEEAAENGDKKEVSEEQRKEKAAENGDKKEVSEEQRKEGNQEKTEDNADKKDEIEDKTEKIVDEKEGKEDKMEVSEHTNEANEEQKEENVVKKDSADKDTDKNVE